MYISIKSCSLDYGFLFVEYCSPEPSVGGSKAEITVGNDPNTLFKWIDLNWDSSGC
jgi:hypothetical protein